MAGLFDRISRLARGRQGQRLIAQAAQRAQQLSKDPATRAKVARVRDEVTRRVNDARRRPGQPGSAQNPTTPPTG
jgi:hypothetical protein